jgi:hypothetical protein
MTRMSLGLAALCACGGAEPRAPLSNTAAPPASAACLAEQQPAGYWGWLDASLAGQVLRVCTIRIDSDEHASRHVACVGVEPDGATVAVPADPPPTTAARHGTLVMRAGMPSACGVDGRCHALGTRAAAAVQDPAHVDVSDDGTLVTSAWHKAVWEVARDRPLDRFAAPDDVDPSYRGTASYDFLGPLVVGAWTPCAGPCTVRRIFRRDGAVIVDRIEDTVGVLALPGEQLAVMQDDLAIHDTRRAALVRRIDVLPPDFPRAYGESPRGGEAMADPLVWLGDGRVAVVVRSKRALEVAIVSLDAGVVTLRVHIPICGDDTRSETSTSAANGTDR